MRLEEILFGFRVAGEPEQGVAVGVLGEAGAEVSRRLDLAREGESAGEDRFGGGELLLRDVEPAERR